MPVEFTNFQSNLSELAQIAKFVLSVMLAAHILVKKQDPVVCLSWLLGVVLFPEFAAICYVGFGLNPFEKYAARKRASKHLASLKRARKNAHLIATENQELMSKYSYQGFDRAAMWVSMLQGQSLQEGNLITPLVNSTSAYAAMTKAIEEARDYIIFQFYQIQADEIGLSFLDKLAHKAEQGVKVFVLFDGLGSHRIKNSLIESYRRRGIKMHRFLEIHPIKRRFQINWRNHRKLVVSDGVLAITGGFNIGQMYLEGADPKRAKWFDLAFNVQGPVIADFISLFAEDWHFTTGKSLPTEILGSRYSPESFQDHAKSLAQIVASGPSENNAPFYSTLIGILHEARHRVWIMTPYFVPDKQLLHAMRLAVVRGVEVQIIVPRHSNHPITDTCAHSYFSEIHHFGIKMLRYPHGVCHGKMVLADNDMVLAGSSNMDYRSFFLNFETDLYVRDRSLADQIQDIMKSVAADCAPLAPRDVSNLRIGRLLFRRIMRLFAPLM
jgi:cardiolipin synthase